VLSGPIVEPNPGPTLAREVAAADKEVTKSKLVIDNNKVIATKTRINTKKKLITDVVTSFSNFL
jgi:hypothetical protein